MGFLPRTVGRICSTIIWVHVGATTGLLLFSKLGNDSAFTEHWQYSTPVLRKRMHYFQFWSPAFFSPSLSKDERRCLDAWMDTLALHSPSFDAPELSPLLVVHDSALCFEGLNEFRDGVYAMEHSFLHAVPYLEEIRREIQGDTTFLHGRVTSDLSLRVPFTSYRLPFGSFSSAFTLQLEQSPLHRSRLQVVAAEHRWFGGPIFSHRTNSVRSPWGDVGDLCRRYNGFILSLMVTKKASLRERRLEMWRRSQLVKEELKKQQIEQINL